jgi:hypothetical protein
VSVLGDAYGNDCVAANEDGARQRGLTTVTVTPLDGAAAPTGSSITLPATGCWHTLPVATTLVRALIRARLQERITSPLTVGGDLGKRRSAQR